MPSKSRKATIRRGFINLYSALFCRGLTGRQCSFLKIRNVQSSKSLGNVASLEPAESYDFEFSFIWVVLIMPSCGSQKMSDSSAI